MYKLKKDTWLVKIISLFGFDAITLGSTIHIKGELAENKRLLNHEKCHVEQFKDYGFIRFVFTYVWYSTLYGYKNNPFEIEARKSEVQTE